MTPSRLTRRPSYKTILAFVLPALLLTGCGSMLNDGRAAPTVWWLEPANLSRAAPLPPIEVELTVVPGLDSDRILTLGNDAQLNHLAGALWPEHLPDWLPSLVRRSLETAPRASAGTTCSLSLEVRRFWVRLDGADRAQTVDFSVSAQVVCGEGTPPAKHRLRSTKTVGDHRLPEIVDAFQDSFEDVMQQLAEALASGAPAGA